MCFNSAKVLNKKIIKTKLPFIASTGLSTTEEIQKELSLNGFEVDYVVTKGGRRFGAVVMGENAGPVRLIDNVEVVS